MSNSIPKTPGLAEAVVRLADEPTTANQNAFFHALANSQVWFPSESLPAGIQPGVPGGYVVGENDRVRIPTAPGPGGSSMLVVIADVASVLAMRPTAIHLAIEGRSLLKIALEKGLGVVVQCVRNGKPSWAGVAREDVARVLESPPPLWVPGC